MKYSKKLMDVLGLVSELNKLENSSEFYQFRQEDTRTYKAVKTQYKEKIQKKANGLTETDFVRFKLITGYRSV
jgi:hypothetical protein